MTEETKLKQVLKNLCPGEWQYHPRVGSTNDLALDWARESALDGSLVLADAQTVGRGRGGRRWLTQPGSSLAMSLILRPNPAEAACLPRFTALPALGLIHALARMGLRAELKWPNDVLLEGKKVAGVLVETAWQGEALEALVVGMGVNVNTESVPEPKHLKYPAISVEEAYGGPVDRWDLLGAALREMMALRRRITGKDFMADWNQALAFRGEWVRFCAASGGDWQECMVRILGVGSDGELVYENKAGEEAKALAGEIQITYNEAKD
jgi:BirA family transcriptional regulator, biotin operon repressor / biotin---[acetyl-CoA-carboxylase] ligase